MRPTVIICPGNGCDNIRQSNWYGEMFQSLRNRGIPCICRDFPDPLHARRNIWVPFVRSLVEENGLADESVILVGHSSGAQAALRYAEQYKLRAGVLVSATYSDLGDAHERASGYYPQPSKSGDDQEESNPYLFDKMKENCPIWHQFHSDDDPFIPLYEAERIRDGLGLSSTYHMIPGKSHFFRMTPELLDVVVSLC